jgi:hypothetical protein
MVAFKLFLAVTANQLVAAWPEPTAAAYLNNRAIDCSKLTGCLGVLKKIGPAATTFCSSYLKIPQLRLRRRQSHLLLCKSTRCEFGGRDS